MEMSSLENNSNNNMMWTEPPGVLQGKVGGSAAMPIAESRLPILLNVSIIRQDEDVAIPLQKQSQGLESYSILF